MTQDEIEIKTEIEIVYKSIARFVLDMITTEQINENDSNKVDNDAVGEAWAVFFLRQCCVWTRNATQMRVQARDAR